MDTTNVTIEEINAGKIYLRKIHKKDYKFFYDCLKNIEMIRYISIGPLLSLEHSKNLLKKYIKYWDEKIQFNYVIEFREKEEKSKIGSISLWNISWLHKRAEIGVWIFPDYWNQGYGKQALDLIIIAAFQHLKLNRLEAHVAVENLRSIHLFKKSGFQEEGRLKRYLNLKGKFHDALILAFLNEEPFK